MTFSIGNCFEKVSEYVILEKKNNEKSNFEIEFFKTKILKNK